MEFGWINPAGGVIVLIMLVPNILYAFSNREAVWERYGYRAGSR